MPISPGRVRNALLVAVALCTLIPAWYCTQPKPLAQSPWRNVYDTSAKYVGMQTCRTCHEPVYQTFIKTGMGQSFDYATRTKSAADFSPTHALVYDSALDYYYKPYWNNDSLYIMEYRLEGRDTIHKLVQKIDYIVGSGQHTNSHIYSINGYLFQAPITFYTQKQQWDLAPGFEKGASSRFGRMIEAECMTCHNGYPDFEPQSDNKFTALKTGIDCERCHGPGSLHVQDKTTGHIVDTSKGPDYSIVNPRRLPTDKQNNICQRCHLQGVAVLNDGKTFFDFRPGMDLSEVEHVFMPTYEGAQDKMIMASHVERMKKSRCYVESGKMSCITCHNPHVSVKFTERSVYINACLNCHGGTPEKADCKAGKAERAAKNDDCVTCHMPHNSSIDIPHVAVTDHYIRKRPGDERDGGKITKFLGMKCINDPNPGELAQARAFLEFFERYASNSPGLLDSASAHLDLASDAERKTAYNKDRIRIWFWRSNFQLITDFAEVLPPDSVNDAWTAYRIGEAYYKQMHPERALNWYKRAVTLEKYALDFENKYATCLLSLGDKDNAVPVLKFILEQNPNNISANTNLGYLEMRLGNDDKALAFMLHAYALDPDYESNLFNLAIYWHDHQKNGEAAKYLRQMLKRHPENARAKSMLADVGH